MPTRAIEDLPLDDDIGSHEGVSLDHTARARIAFLLGQSQAMVSQTQFADAKAGALLAFIGLVATRGPGGLEGLSPLTIGATLILVLHASTVALCIYVFFPRYANVDVRSRMVNHERYSWPALAAAGYDDDKYADYMHHAEVSQLVVSIARSNHALARILLTKFATLRAAFVVAVADVLVMGARALA